MEEPISVRITRLNQQLVSPYSRGGTSINSKLNIESLQDALIALFDECCKRSLKYNPDVAEFLKKFKDTVKELKSLRIKPSDFEVKSLIGRGHFGEVSLVKEKATGHMYAMKILPKPNSQAIKDASSYEDERDILALAAKPGAPEWLTALQYSFQDSSNLYLVMEYLPGGDLLSLLDRFDGKLPEDYVKFYLAEVIQAANSLHQLGYVHRDIKPDNVLLDRCGHIKLADFGSAAKLNSDGKVNSPLPVGTPEYIAPEVLQSVTGENVSYGIECDYWAIGVLAYELIYNSTPFQGAETTKIYSNIMSHEDGEKLEFPSDGYVSRDLKSLITGLLQPATTRYNYVLLKKHKFFSDVSLDSIRDSVPPYVPVVVGEFDTSNFLDVSTNGNTTKNNITNGFEQKTYSDFTGQQLPFIGFTLTPGIVATKTLYTRHNDSNDSAEQEIPNRPTDHPDVIRNREIKVLKDLLKEKDTRLDDALKERREAENKLEKTTLKALSYKQSFEKEKKDRAEVEAKTIEKVKSLKELWQKQAQEQIAEYSSKLQKLEIELGDEKAKANEFEKRLANREEQLQVEKESNNSLQGLLQKRKDSMTKARRETLTNFGDIQEITQLRMKIGILEADKNVFCNKAEFLSKQNRELEEEIKKLCDQLEKGAETIDSTQTLLIATQERLKRVESKYLEEKAKHKSTKAKLTEVEAELSNSIAILEQTKESINIDKSFELEIDILKSKLEKCEREKTKLSKEIKTLEETTEQNESLKEQFSEKMLLLEERLTQLEAENVKLAESERRATISARKSIDTSATQVLQAQIERLESNLDKAKENAMLEKQAARTAESSLYKKEKELSDAKIDLRIVRRELKTAEDELTTLRNEKEELTKKLSESDNKLTEVRSQLENTKKDLESAKLKITKLETQLQTLRDREDESQTRFVEQTKRLTSLEDKTAEKTELAAKLQTTVDNLRKQLKELTEISQSSNSELEQLKSQVKVLQMNYDVLKQTCEEFDEQLSESEELRSIYEEKIKSGNTERARLQSELDNALGNLRAKTAEADEMRALRKAAEERLTQANNNAKFQADEANEENNDLKLQLDEAKHQSEQLLAQVNELEVALCENDRELRENNSILEAMKLKCTSLQEEMSKTLTDLQSARDACDSLSIKLEAAKKSEKDTAQKLSETENKFAEEQARTKEEIIKFQRTIEQHSKLIDFLQNKPVQRKKKTIADVLFGIRPKENIPPSPLRSTGQNTPMNAPKTPMSAQKIREAKEKSKTWEPRSTTDKVSTGTKTYQTPLNSKHTPLIKKDDEKLAKKESVKKAISEMSISPDAPIVLDRRVLPEHCRMTINCAVAIAENVTLLGAEEGLFSLHPRTTGYQLVKIQGVNKIKKLVLASHIGHAIFLSGSTSTLHQCELRALTVAGEAAECSKPNISLKVIEHIPEDCQVFSVSPALPSKLQNSCHTILCAANRTHVAIMRWNLGSSVFEPLRLLSTTLPIASILYTQHSLLLVCDEVIEIDLQDFSVDEFLDQADNSLLAAKSCLKTRLQNDNVGIFEVTKPGSKEEPEFLLCLPQCAVYLDSFGHRSRPGDLKWSYRPEAYMQRGSLLYVQHSTGILVINPSDSKLCIDDDSSSRISNISTKQDPFILKLTTPKLLGPGIRTGSIIVRSQEDIGTAILTIQGPDAEDDDIDGSESGRDEFSFTSSLEHSLDSDLSDNTKKVQFN